jgi:hypothetical protein
MDDEGKRREERRRGELARQVLENEVFADAVRELADHYTREWAATEPQEHKKREYLYTKVQCLWELRRDLQSVMETGQFAQQQMESPDRSGE